MIHYPHIMRKAQAQIDKVVGRDRVPTFADRPHLPYIRAVVKEVLRWWPVGPVGMQGRFNAMIRNLIRVLRHPEAHSSRMFMAFKSVSILRIRLCIGRFV